MIREAVTAWQGADICLKVLLSVLLLGGTLGWLCALVECTPKRRETSKFLNTNGWKIK